MAACGINSSEISFLEKNISPTLQVMRWLKFCKTVHIHKCNLYSMKPPLTNISYMMSQSTHEDCFNTRTLTAYCISIILSAFIIVANTVILTAFVRDRSKLLRSSNLPIISLALSDLLTGITFLYSSTWNLVILTAGYEFDIFKTLHYVRLRTNKYLCLTLDGPGFVFTCLMSSVLSLGIIASDRYLSIFYSYKYPTWITMPRMTVILVITWVVAILVGVLPLCGWNEWTDSSTCQLTKVMNYGYLALWSTICFLIGLIILFIYIRIFMLARKHSRQIEASRVSQATETYSLPSSSESSTSGDQNKLIKDRRKASEVSSGLLVRDSVDYGSQDQRERKESQPRKVCFRVHSPIAETSFIDKQETGESGTHDKVNEQIAISKDDHKSIVTKAEVNDTNQESNTNGGKVSEADEASYEQNHESGTDWNSDVAEESRHKANAEVVSELDSGICDSSHYKESNVNSSNTTDQTAQNTGEVKESASSSNVTSRYSISSVRVTDKRRNRRPTMKAVRTTAMILGAFYICWTPFLAYLLAFRDDYDNLILYYLAVVTQVNSIFNPIMYGFRQSDIKRAIKRLFPCIKSK